MPARLGEGPLAGHRLLAVSSGGRWGKGSLWSLLYKSTNPIHEVSTLTTESTPQRPDLLISSPWGLGFQHMDWKEIGGHKRANYSVIHLYYAAVKNELR